MAKKTKESIPLSLRMEKEIFERLENFCEESGLSKTVAVERAVNMFIDDYENKVQLLKDKGVK